MSNPSESTIRSVEALNNRLAEELRKKTMISEEILKISLQDCNRQNINLGQTLVQKRYLAMSDLVQIIKNMRSVQPSVPPAPLPKEEIQEKSGTMGIVGSEFAGHEIINEIARGGMGIVYRAYQRDMKRTVALKVLLGGTSADAQQIRRFFREAKATASLVHPNIIPIYSVGDFQNYHYFTMKYIDGGTFEKWIASDVPLVDKIRIVIKIAYALDYAHEKNILHRDIKPSNILLDKDQEPYLTDFGLAKFIDSTSLLTQTGTALGTPFYMSPEQVQGLKRKIGRQSDIYSLGVVLYQVLTTSLPFTAETVTELYRKIVEEEPAWPKDIPDGLLCVCQKAMEKSPEFRYNRAEEMAKDLERFCSGEKVMAKKINVRTYLARFARKNRKQLKKIMGIYLPIVAFIFLLVYGLHFFQAKKAQEFSQKKLEEQHVFSESKKLYEKGQYHESLQYLLNNAKKLDHSPAFYLELSLLYRQLDRFEDSEQALVKAESLLTDKEEILYHKSLLSYDKGNYEKALQQIEKYLQKKENQTSQAFYHKGKILQKSGQKEEAKKIIDFARNQQNIEAKQWLARIEEYIQKKETNQALNYLEMVLSKYPLCEKAYLLRAEIYSSMGENDRALNDISSMAEYNPNFASLLMKAQWMEKAGYFQEAKDAYGNAREEATEEKDVFWVLEALGNMDFQLKNYEQAISCYEEIYQKDKSKKEILFKIARTAFYAKKYDLVKKHLQSIEKELPREMKAQALYYQGVIAQQDKEEARSIDLLEKALTLGVSYQENIHILLGEIYYSQKKFDKALEYLKKAYKTSSENVHAQWILGNTAMECKDYAQAVQSFSWCITLEPWKAIYYNKRGKAYSELEQFDKAEEDFFKCQQLEPDFLEPILNISQNAFRQQFLHKILELRIILGKYHYSFDPKSIDLFAQDAQRLQSEYIQKSLLLKQEIRTRKKWDAKKAEIAIRGLIENDSPSVHSIVNSSLLAMYYEPDLQSLLEKEIQNKKHRHSVIQRLSKIAEQIRQKYFQEQKIILFSCLVRYYSAKDMEAIKEIYHTGDKGIRCLSHILEDKSSPNMMRFLAARMLCDLKIPEAYVTLLESCKSKDSVIRLFSSCVIIQQRKNLDALQFFEKLPTFEEPYLRAIAARYIPEEYTEVLKNVFLKDPDPNVRLVAASRLRWTEDKISKAELIKAFSSPYPQQRLYAHASFWNFDPIEKKEPTTAITEDFPFLLEAVKDENLEIRRIAIFQLAKFENPKSTEVLKSFMKEENDSIRLQAIISLAHIMALDSVMPLVKNPNEPLIFRLAVLLGASNSIKKDPTSMLMVANSLFQDPDERMRIIVFSILGRWGKKFGTQFILNYLQSPDSYTRFGAICGIMSGDKPEGLNHIVKFLKDPDFKVRSAAAMCLISILGKYDQKKAQSIHEKIQNEDKAFKKTAALGYSKILQDIFNFYPPEEIKWDWHSVQLAFFHEMVVRLDRWKSDETTPAVTSYDVFSHYLSQALLLDPDNPRYFFERGLVYYVSKRYEESLADMKKAWESNKEFPTYQFWLAKLYYHNKNYEQAERLLNTFLYRFPWYYEANVLKAEIFKVKNQLEDAKRMQNTLMLLRTLKKTQ